MVFSEPVLEFSSDDITVPSGSLTTAMHSDQANDNQTIWDGIFTPTTNTEVDINRLELARCSGCFYTDLAGTNGLDNQTAIYDVDTKPPSVEYFLMSDVTLRRNDNATVELRFSEPVIDFSNADITIPNLDQEPRHDNSTASGILTTMTSIDNRTWTGTFMPTFFTPPNTEDWTNRLVVSDNYTDIDNNAGTGMTGPNYMVDDIYPIKHGSPTITLDVANRSNDELILWAQTTECIACLLYTSPSPRDGLLSRMPSCA